MTSNSLRILLMAGVVTLGACMKEGAGSNDTGTATANTANATAAAASNDPITSAESAAPAAIARNASVVTVDAKGAMTTRRKGSNGWTCMPDAPDTPGPDPMCFDQNAANWVQAWVGRKPPPANAVGLMYMLEGGTDASNTDPYATAPTKENHWVETGPHVMIVGAAPEFYAMYPGQADPDTAAPYVMWSGTPYQHLMIPVK